MKITIEDIVYEQTKVRGSSVRKFLEAQEALDTAGSTSPKSLDIIYQFIVDFFDNKFTSDVFEEMDIEETMDDYNAISSAISTKMNSSVSKYQKN